MRELTPPAAVRVVLGVVKTLSIMAGAVLSVLCGMAVMALMTRSLLVQLIPALVVTVALPLVISERLLRDPRGQRREGLATDVLALFWSGFALVFIAGAFPVTQPLLLREAEFMARSGDPTAERVAPVVAWIARGRTGRSITSVDVDEEVTLRPNLGMSSHGEEEPEADAGASGDGGLEELLDGAVDGDVEAAPPPVLTPEEILERFAPSLVTLSVRRADGSDTSATGFVIESGLVVTAARAVSGAQAVAIRLPSGQWAEEVTLEARDVSRGVALLAMNDEQTPPVESRSESSAEVGDPLFVLGNALGIEPVLIEGQIDELGAGGGDDSRPRPSVITAPVSAATLGGPVINQWGELTGIAIGTVRRPSLRREGEAPSSLMTSVEEISRLERDEEGLQLFGRRIAPPVRW